MTEIGRSDEKLMSPYVGIPLLVAGLALACLLPYVAEGPALDEFVSNAPPELRNVVFWTAAGVSALGFYAFFRWTVRRMDPLDGGPG